MTDDAPDQREQRGAHADHARAPDSSAGSRGVKHRALDRLDLKTDSRLSEKWVEERLTDDPGLLGLGRLHVVERQRAQSQRGRLDLLLSDRDPDRETRYVVEIQLGATDPDHIVRTVEYWDQERERFPQHDHVAVIVAEDVTSRFFNVIRWFARAIPLIALQVTALELADDEVALVVRSVLDLQPTELGGDEPEERDTRAAWEGKASPETLGWMDDVLSIVHEFDPEVALNYTKNYVGLARSGGADNYVQFRPKAQRLIVEAKLPYAEEHDRALEAAGVEQNVYNVRWGRFRPVIVRGTLDDPAQRAALKDLLADAHRHSRS